MTQEESELYKISVWKLYILSDIMEGCSLDIERSTGVKHEQKHRIKQIKKLSSDFVKHVDNKCSDYTIESFGELSDEVNTLITSYIKNGVNKINNNR